MTVTINGTNGVTTPEVVLDNSAADGAQVVLKSSGYSDWNLDNYSGRLRAYYGATEYLTVNTSGNLGIGTSSPDFKLTLQSGGDVQMSFKDSGGTTRAYIGTAGAFGTAPTGALRIRSDQGGIVFGISGTETARIDSSGILLYGMTTRLNAGNEGALVQIKGTAVTPLAMENGDNNFIQAFWSKGTTSLCGSIQKGAGLTTSYVTSSDYRAKEDVQPMTGALVRVAALKPVTYKWKVDGSDGEGFIAHELQEVCPAAVAGEKDAVDADGNPQYQGIDTSFLVATLTSAIQELKAINDAQAETITALTARVTALEGA